LNGAGWISPVSGSSNSSLKNSTNIVFFDSSKSLNYLDVISFKYWEYFLKSSSSINLSAITLLASFLHNYTITSLGFNPTFFNEFLISSLSILKQPNIILLISFIVKLYVNFWGVGINFSLTVFHKSIVAEHNKLIFSFVNLS